jgi:hypothetical protein
MINICLKKTGLTLPINENCQIQYTNWAGSGYSILSSIYLSTERYFQNDSEPMDCESVLQSLLQIFNCTLIQQEGEWQVYRSIDLKSQMLVTLFINGLYDKNVTKYYGHNLGSEINGFEIFHCNSNQTKTVSASIQAYMISYQYGTAINVLANGGFDSTDLIGGGPAFRAYVNTLQTITSGSQQKVTFGTENFDTNNNFASSTFTPTVAGYYQLNATVRISGGSSTGETMLVIWKNGSEYARGTNQSGTEQGANFYSMQVSDIAVANGSTDYFEIYIQQTSGVSREITAGSNISYFSGCMIRGA